MLGERPSQLVSFEMQKLMAGAVMSSPYLPMLFMGEEWGELNPFLYFVSHSDSDLIDAVRQGRKKEFAAFQTDADAAPVDTHSQASDDTDIMTHRTSAPLSGRNSSGNGSSGAPPNAVSVLSDAC